MKPVLKSASSWCLSSFALTALLLCSPDLFAQGQGQGQGFTTFSNCRVTSANPISIPVAYDPFSATVTVSVTVNIACSRDGGGVMPVAPTLAVGNGLYSSGISRRANFGSNYIEYGLWQDGASKTAWNSSSVISVANMIWNNSSGTGSTNFHFNLPAGQNQVGVGSPYSDSVSVTLTYPTSDKNNYQTTTLSLATVEPSITIAPGCRLSSTPGDLTFSYTSFQVAPAQASTSFAAKCVKDTSYTMALDATSGTLLGLNYSLAISPTGQRTGSGVDQSVTISGTIAADQSGTCATSSCTARQSRTFTITY